MGLGVLVLAAVVAGGFWHTKGSHLELRGQVLKARTGALDDRSSIVVLDFRVLNPSDVRFVVRETKITLEKASGEKIDGQMISKADMQQLFAYNKFLGPQYNDALVIRDTAKPHNQIDRMVAARFEIPEQELENSKAVVLWIQDMDGAEFETTFKLK